MAKQLSESEEKSKYEIVAIKKESKFDATFRSVLKQLLGKFCSKYGLNDAKSDLISKIRDDKVCLLDILYAIDAVLDKID